MYDYSLDQVDGQCIQKFHLLIHVKMHHGTNV